MNEHVVIGTRQDWGAEAPLVLSADDRRRHLEIIGMTGTGKSTLMLNMMVQDLVAGRGFALVDPHGTLAADLLPQVRKRRVNEVVYFDPSDLEHPIGINVLGSVPRERRSLAASGIISIFKGMYPDFWGPRLEYILYACVAALLECEHVSLMGITRMLHDPMYRNWVVRQVKDPMVRSFWENEFARYNDRFLQEAIAPIQNKVGQLFMAPEVRNVLGQVRSRVNFRSIMDEGGVFVANLSKGKIGEDKANLLGAICVTCFQLAAMSRVDMPEHGRRDFHLYVDEFHSFATDSFATILSEARKYRLGLTLAHQYLDQVKPNIRAAVMGNVGSLISFRIGHEDAVPIAKAFGNRIEPAQFTSLDNGEIFARLLSNGRNIEPTLGRTHLPPPPRRGREHRIMRNSRNRFARERRVVEEKINRWLFDPPV